MEAMSALQTAERSCYFSQSGSSSSKRKPQSSRKWAVLWSWALKEALLFQFSNHKAPQVSLFGEKKKKKKKAHLPSQCNDMFLRWKWLNGKASLMKLSSPSRKMFLSLYFNHQNVLLFKTRENWHNISLWWLRKNAKCQMLGYEKNKIKCSAKVITLNGTSHLNYSLNLIIPNTDHPKLGSQSFYAFSC